MDISFNKRCQACSPSVPTRDVRGSFLNFREVPNAGEWRSLSASSSEHPQRSSSYTRTSSAQSSNKHRSDPYKPKSSLFQLYDQRNVQGQLPPYFSFQDPHLKDFYLRKFFAIAHNDLLRSGLLSMNYSSNSLSAEARKRKKKKKKSSGDHEASYTVSVTTGKQKNAGTNANVFLTLNGTLGKINRKQLMKKNSFGFYPFVRGKMQVFKFGGVNHDGVLEEDGWFLEEIKVFKINLESNKSKSWIFMCNDWLSLHASDGLIKRKLFVGSSVAKEKTDYEVTVVTGDVKGAGTNAHVFITIFGIHGQTDKIHLSNSSEDKENFEKGKSSFFRVAAKSVGIVNKIRIEHDNTGFAAGWFLSKVIISDLNNPKQIYYFPCNQWLAKDEGDGSIYRDLMASSNPNEGSQKSKKYKVVISTGDKRGAGTDANVSIQLFGANSDSGEKKLDARFKNDFERNQVDEFTIECPDLGELKRIRIGHDNTGSSPGWFLNKVEVYDPEKNQKFEFPCLRWLATDEDDGQTYRDLTCGSDSSKPGVPYEIKVKTGNVLNAGTSANVFVVMYGGGKINSRDDEDEDDNEDIGWKKSGRNRRKSTSSNVNGEGSAMSNSGKVWLKGCKFERNRIDICKVDVAEDLSPLSRLDIGHDNKGAGPGWFLDEVVVTCLRSGIEQTFACKKWFAVNEDDGLIERSLQETSRFVKEKKVTWSVRVYTSDERGAGTDANVFMVLYGKKKVQKKNPSKRNEKLKNNSRRMSLAASGVVDSEDDDDDDDDDSSSDSKKALPSYFKTKDIVLDNKGNNFESGQVDVFVIEAEEVGQPIKLRVWHDNSKPFAAWKLNKIEMENQMTNKTYTFPCNRWLSKDDDDKEIIRELPATEANITHAFNVMKYKIFIHTGKKMGAGTDANVFLCIFGDNGDTGDRPLTRSINNQNKFERGKVDEFEIEAVDLKKLRKVRIGHDGKNAGSGWFLEKIVVQLMNTSKDSPPQTTVFDCNRWLDVKEDDGQIVRELTAGGVQMLETTSYHVSVRTGTCRHAGTDANVHMEIFGSSGSTGKLALKDSENGNKNKFEAGRVDLFKIEAVDIGKVKKILIGHDGSKAGSGWFVDDVTVKVPSRGETYTFMCNKWFDKKEDDGLIERELYPSDRRKSVDEKQIPYCVTIWTGDKRGGGTDANVFLQMYGENGKTEEIQMRNRTDNFEKGQKDIFKIEAVDVGRIFKIRVGHDGNGSFSGWFLSKILIQRPPSSKKKEELKKLNNELMRSKMKSQANNKSFISHNRSNGKQLLKRQSSLSVSFDEDSVRNSKRTPRKHDVFGKKKSSYGSHYDDDDDDEDDDDDDDGSEDDDEDGYGYDDRMRKEMDRRTGRNGMKEMDSRRKSLAGSRNLYDDRRGFKSQKHSNHYNGDEDEDDDDDGDSANDLNDDKSDDDEVKNEDNIEEYWFVCEKWFATNEGDGKIVRELLPTTAEGKATKNSLEEVVYLVKIFTGDKFGAGTDANVYVKLSGSLGDSGEVHMKDSNNANKFERKKMDVFKVTAVDLGQLKKLQISHDNKGGNAGWFLDHVEVEDSKNKVSYYFDCKRWLAVDEDDGQLSRVLVPKNDGSSSKSNSPDNRVTDGRRKNSEQRSSSRNSKEAGRSNVRSEEPREETPTTYRVRVYTGSKFGAGTDANVHIILFGERDDTGKIMLKTSKTNKNKFERNQMDEFTIEAFDIGDLKKIKIGHDNTGAGGAWYLDRVEIDIPATGVKWIFPHSRWLAKNEDDGKLEREILPAAEDFEYNQKKKK